MNQDKLFLQPAKPNVRVRHADRSGHLNIHGEYVTQSIHWKRRLRDGDVIQLTKESEIKKAIANAKAADAPTSNEES
ncbi:DUF2635 domain-containing protein [Methylophaga nitratireducenticrescens]|uniref:DUF2635 domain-containing protein n=1 Tax=Methylophaga nitratireducenticrescens TaxID=754476 RepID=UPI000CDCB7E2|nr:DUF2635 domain-containing protein [Methylophaga nitratireducenticrescens]AUZ85848.1 hypothetical protein CDW43_15305 [Methylophaga nitratireducenticrescens]